MCTSGHPPYQEDKGIYASTPISHPIIHRIISSSFGHKDTVLAQENSDVRVRNLTDRESQSRSICNCDRKHLRASFKTSMVDKEKTL